MSGKRAQEKKRAYLKRRDESLAKQARAVEAELRGEADPVVRMLIRGKAGFLDPAEAARLFLGAVGRDLRYDLEADGFVVRGGYRDAYWHELKSFGALLRSLRAGFAVLPGPGRSLQSTLGLCWVVASLRRWRPG